MSKGQVAKIVAIGLMLLGPLPVFAQTRPSPMGVIGANEAYNVLATGQCIDEAGTLGALLTNGTTTYILGAEHVLAVNSTGYYASGSGEPIVQPDPTHLSGIM